MAVEDTTTGDDTGVQEDDGVELEDAEVNFETEAHLDDGSDDESEDTISDEMEEESGAEETESKDESEDETKDEGETETEESEDLQPEDTKEQESDEERKRQNDEFAKRRIQEREAREAKLVEDQQSYVADAEDDKDAALRQLQVESYNTRVEANLNKITNGYQRAVNDFEILRNPDPVVQEAINEAVDTFQALHVELDGYGNPKKVTGDLYQFLQTKADSIQKLTGIGARQQQTNKGKEKSKTFTPPVRQPKAPAKDELIEGFDEEAERW